MGKTKVEISGKSFLINGKKTYSEIHHSNPNVHGLLMNARFIQGIFDDQENRQRYTRFGKEFDPEKNTDDLIASLSEWYKYGLRAFTVGFQGGGPCFTIDASTIHNNPFGEDGTNLDPAYASRMDRLIKAADELGMVVIVSYFYIGQAMRLKDDQAVRNAVKTATRFLREGGYTNVLIEIANEHNIITSHKRIADPDGMVTLIELAQEESGGIPVGCSGTGHYVRQNICRASDYILIHGNGTTRQSFYNMIKEVEAWEPNKPIVCNEDSNAIGQIEVAFKTKVSWGYYNNMTKQEPPTDWSITPGEDHFFAYRMAEGIGIEIPKLNREEQYYLQGLEPHMEHEGKRWIRLASLYPETISYVDFYRNGELVHTSYDDPFSIHFIQNWWQGATYVREDDREWIAEIHLGDGSIVTKTVKV